MGLTELSGRDEGYMGKGGGGVRRWVFSRKQDGFNKHYEYLVTAVFQVFASSENVTILPPLPPLFLGGLLLLLLSSCLLLLFYGMV